MNAVLLLRLSAPMQSWGTDSKFENRTTQREPSKSGVIGMLAAALGREREDSVEDLAMLGFGVRIDQPGQLLRDFHTARPEKAKNPYVTERYYLMDATFLVGLEGDITFLQELEIALKFPVFPIYLGRRSCPPVGNLCLGIRENITLRDALYNEPWQGSEWYSRKIKDTFLRLTLVIDSATIGSLRRRDVPISFSHLHRKHAYRYVDDIPQAVKIPNPYQKTITTEHDIWEEV